MFRASHRGLKGSFYPSCCISTILDPHITKSSTLTSQRRFYRVFERVANLTGGLTQHQKEQFLEYCRCLLEARNIDTINIKDGLFDTTSRPPLPERFPKVNVTGAKSPKVVYDEHFADGLLLIPVIEQLFGIRKYSQPAIASCDPSSSTILTESHEQHNSTLVSPACKVGSEDNTKDGMTNKSKKRSLTLVDVGSGGGLPGLALAIARPEWRFILVDTVSKKVNFLRATAAHLGLRNVHVIESTAEALSMHTPRLMERNRMHAIDIERKFGKAALTTEYKQKYEDQLLPPRLCQHQDIPHPFISSSPNSTPNNIDPITSVHDLSNDGMDLEEEIPAIPASALVRREDAPLSSTATRSRPLREVFDAVISRGVAQLPQLSEACLPLLRKGGYLLTQKTIKTSITLPNDNDKPVEPSIIPDLSLSKLSPKHLKRLPANRVSSISTESLANHFTKDHIAILSIDQLRSLTSSQIDAIPSHLLASLPPSTLAEVPSLLRRIPFVPRAIELTKAAAATPELNDSHDSVVMAGGLWPLRFVPYGSILEPPVKLHVNTTACGSSPTTSQHICASEAVSQPQINVSSNAAATSSTASGSMPASNSSASLADTASQCSVTLPTSKDPFNTLDASMSQSHLGLAESAQMRNNVISDKARVVCVIKKILMAPQSLPRSTNVFNMTPLNKAEMKAKKAAAVADKKASEEVERKAAEGVDEDEEHDEANQTNEVNKVDQANTQHDINNKATSIAEHEEQDSMSKVDTNKSAMSHDISASGGRSLQVRSLGLPGSQYFDAEGYLVLELPDNDDLGAGWEGQTDIEFDNNEWAKPKETGIGLMSILLDHSHVKHPTTIISSHDHVGHISNQTHEDDELGDDSAESLWSTETDANHSEEYSEDTRHGVDGEEILLNEKPTSGSMTLPPHRFMELEKKLHEALHEMQSSATTTNYSTATLPSSDPVGQAAAIPPIPPAPIITTGSPATTLSSFREGMDRTMPDLKDENVSHPISSIAIEYPKGQKSQVLSERDIRIRMMAGIDLDDAINDVDDYDNASDDHNMNKYDDNDSRTTLTNNYSTYGENTGTETSELHGKALPTMSRAALRDNGTDQQPRRQLLNSSSTTLFLNDNPNHPIPVDHREKLAEMTGMPIEYFGDQPMTRKAYKRLLRGEKYERLLPYTRERPKGNANNLENVNNQRWLLEQALKQRQKEIEKGHGDGSKSDAINTLKDGLAKLGTEESGEEAHTDGNTVNYEAYFAQNENAAAAQKELERAERLSMLYAKIEYESRRKGKTSKDNIVLSTEDQIELTKLLSDDVKVAIKHGLLSSGGLDKVVKGMEGNDEADNVSTRKGEQNKGVTADNGRIDDDNHLYGSDVDVDHSWWTDLSSWKDVGTPSMMLQESQVAREMESKRNGRSGNSPIWEERPPKNQSNLSKPRKPTSAEGRNECAEKANVVEGVKKDKAIYERKEGQMVAGEDNMDDDRAAYAEAGSGLTPEQLAMVKEKMRELREKTKRKSVPVDNNYNRYAYTSLARRKVSKKEEELSNQPESYSTHRFDSSMTVGNLTEGFAHTDSLDGGTRQSSSLDRLGQGRPIILTRLSDLMKEGMSGIKEIDVPLPPIHKDPGYQKEDDMMSTDRLRDKMDYGHGNQRDSEGWKRSYQNHEEQGISRKYYNRHGNQHSPNRRTQENSFEVDDADDWTKGWEEQASHTRSHSRYGDREMMPKRRNEDARWKREDSRSRGMKQGRDDYGERRRNMGNISQNKQGKAYDQRRPREDREGHRRDWGRSQDGRNKPPTSNGWQRRSRESYSSYGRQKQGSDKGYRGNRDYDVTEKGNI